MMTGVVALVLALVGCLEGPAEIEPPPDDARSVLFLGNSLTYTNDLPLMLDRMLEEGLGEDRNVPPCRFSHQRVPPGLEGRGR